MPSKKSYSRFFIILQEDQKGYGTEESKSPSGYAKLEIMNDKAKASFYVQNLKRQKGPYHMILIVQGKNQRELINLGQINIDDMGKADICNEYNANNVANTSLSMDKVQGAAICRVIGDKVNPIMVGFSCGEELRDWNSYPIAANEKQGLKVAEIIKNNEDSKELKNRKAEEQATVRRNEEVKRSDLIEKQQVSPLKIDVVNKEKLDLEKEKLDLENEKIQFEERKSELENQKIELENQKVELGNQKAKLENEKTEWEKKKSELENEKESLKLQMDKCDKEMEQLKADKNKLMMDIQALNDEKDKLMKNKEEFENQKESLKQKEAKLCKYFKFIRDGELENGQINTEEENEQYSDEDNEALETITKAIKESQTFDEYEEEIEKFKNYRHKHEKHKKENSNMNKCKVYPKEKKEEFFKEIVKDLEKIGEKENIKNCKWYKVNVEKLESMYCIYDYNKYALIFYPMICYYPYISKNKNFLIGYKYDEGENLKYIIYAIPGTKELKDQPYEGKTGFVTFMPEDHCEDKGYWLMYFDIEKNSVVIPVKRS